MAPAALGRASPNEGQDSSNAMKLDTRSNPGRTSCMPQQRDGLQKASPLLTIWFDGGCPLCRREFLLIQKLDQGRAIYFEDVDRADALCPLDRAELLSRFHARERGQPIVSGAAAFAARWRAIPLLRLVGELARLAPVLWAIRFVYRRLPIIQPRLQNLVQQAGA